jgi:hypothetical protein
VTGMLKVHANVPSAVVSKEAPPQGMVAQSHKTENGELAAKPVPTSAMEAPTPPENDETETTGPTVKVAPTERSDWSFPM